MGTYYGINLNASGAALLGVVIIGLALCGITKVPNDTNAWITIQLPAAIVGTGITMGLGFGAYVAVIYGAKSFKALPCSEDEKCKKK